MKTLLLAALMLSSWPAFGRAEAVKRYVTLGGTRLLSKAAAFSKSYGSLKLGQMVWAEDAGNGYYKVSVPNFEDLGLKKGKGFLSRRALQEDRPKIGATARKSSDASAEEVAAATKGFNKQVEAQYKKDNASLDYELVTKLEERTRIENPQDSLKEFRAKGKLGEFSDANKDKGGEDE